MYYIISSYVTYDNRGKLNVSPTPARKKVLYAND